MGVSACGGRWKCSPQTPSHVSLVSVSPLKVDCVLGKVFFSTEAVPGELRKLKSGERLFLLLKKRAPLAVSRNKGAALTPSHGASPHSWACIEAEAPAPVLCIKLIFDLFYLFANGCSFN